MAYVYTVFVSKLLLYYDYAKKVCTFSQGSLNSLALGLKAYTHSGSWNLIQQKSSAKLRGPRPSFPPIHDRSPRVTSSLLKKSLTGGLAGKTRLLQRFNQAADANLPIAPSQDWTHRNRFAGYTSCLSFPFRNAGIRNGCASSK